jgi:hypothetical protein
MASKQQKRTAKPRKPVDLLSEIQKLKKQIVELRKKLKLTEWERDGLRPLAHEYVKSTITQEEIESGFDGEFIEGSLVGFLKEAEKEYKKKNRNGKKAS